MPIIFFQGTGVEQGLTAVCRCNNDKSNNSEMSSSSSRSYLSKEMLITGESCQWLSNKGSQSSFAVQT